MAISEIIAWSLVAICLVALYIFIQKSYKHIVYYRKQCKVYRDDAVCYNAASQSNFAAYNLVTMPDGKAQVVRSIQCGTYTYNTNIKLFDDADASFNLREAQELVEKLNEQ